MVIIVLPFMAGVGSLALDVRSMLSCRSIKDKIAQNKITENDTGAKLPRVSAWERNESRRIDGRRFWSWYSEKRSGCLQVDDGDVTVLMPRIPRRRYVSESRKQQARYTPGKPHPEGVEASVFQHWISGIQVPLFFESLVSTLSIPLYFTKDMKPEPRCIVASALGEIGIGMRHPHARYL